MKKINLLSALFLCTILASCASENTSSSSSYSSSSTISSSSSSSSSTISSSSFVVSSVSSSSTISSSSTSSSSISNSSTSSSSISSSSSSSISSSTSVPSYEGNILSLNSKNFNSVDALVLNNITPNTQYESEFTFDKNGSYLSSKRITEIEKIEVLVYGTYDNLKMYASENADEEKLITATKEEKTSENEAQNNVLYTYSFDTPTDVFYLTNPSTYNVQVFTIDIYYKGQINDAEPEPVEKDITISRALEIGNALSSSRGTTETTYIINGVVTNISGKEVTITQDDSSIIAYVPTPVENLYIGYSVALEGKIQNYYGKIEIVEFTLLDYLAATYNVDLQEFENGIVNVSKSSDINYGEEITLTAVPNEEYKVLSLFIDNERQNLDENNSISLIMTHNISVKAEFISNDVVIEETVTLKYVFADYPAGTQYATETHKLDENTSISTEKAHFTSELRLYNSSTNDSVATIHSAKPIKSIYFNAGYSASELSVYGSTDGETFELISALVTTSAYKVLSLENIEESSYTYIKLDVTGSKQVRIKDFSIVVAK